MFDHDKISGYKLVRSKCRGSSFYTSFVHTGLVSRPEVYLKFTSDVNRSNCSVSWLLCSRGNDFSSKEPKYTSK